MAKPLPVASSSLPGSSKTIHCSPQQIPEPSNHPRRRTRRPAKPPLAIVAPSSGLLSLLASIVSATTVNGGSVPPDFLCPSIRSEDVVEPVARRRTVPTDPRFKAKSFSANLPPSRHVPDRYDRDTDGVWRRVGSYTLYGSTVSPACTGICPPSNQVSSVDDQIQVGDQNATTPSIPSYDLIQDSLPPGWKPTSKPYAGRTTLILAMSLVLAFFICFFIVGCLFFRKGVRKNRKQRDIEAKARRRRDAEVEQDTRGLAAEKEMKAQQKLWARATARWRANVRYVARQRRGKRPSSRSSHAHQPTISLDNSRSHLARQDSLPLSARSSPQSSTESIPDQLRDVPEPVATPTLPSQDPIAPAATAQNPTPTSPPAYQHGGPNPPIIVSTSDSISDHAGPSRFDRSRRPSQSSSNSPLSLRSDTDNSGNSAFTPLHVAHVATDDKSLLARLADLASAPPPEESPDSAGSSDSAQVSAPAWHDEDMESNQPNDLSAEASSCSLSPMFPPPPSKERLAAAEFYDYPFAFDEMDPPILDSEPSAPPFEAVSSLTLELVPSAPSLLYHSDHFIPDSEASAPEWDPGDEQPNTGLENENPSGQDHDRISPEEVTAHGSPPSTSIAQSTSMASSLRESVVLPGYQP
ncbi:hypothetical protein M413DRAFT_22191 [Hebeloma cylindrosporum]|uniref:Uncharacterized protein n=1 Tax=Hebeloma cylindrosporum TaxID=76867 RepID=A0A0C3CFM6_HEBCY|nr:hypothetical protein M413DRAFT_22191 [Hebeloma cylindrosporum h7]